MSSLWVKLLTVFILVTFVAAGVVAVVANIATTRLFNRYLEWGGQVRARRIAPLAAEYYTRQGSWRGVENLLSGLSRMEDMRRGMQQLSSLSYNRLMLVDMDGTVTFDSQQREKGHQLARRALALGVPVMADGRRVGTILVTPPGQALADSLERRFLTLVNRWFIAAGILAGGLALILGVYLAWQITAPLRELRGAAQAIASGDFGKRVTVSTRDEIGDLARAFNHMAEVLERNAHLRRRLMADISHELRTPLSVISANLEALRDGVFPLTRESLAPLNEEALLLTRLVEDLRQLALAETGQLTLDCEEVSLEDLIQQVVEGHHRQAAEKRIKLKVEIPQRLPMVTLDPQRISQVLRNLLANALRYTPDRGEITVAGWLFEVRPGQLSSSDRLPSSLLPLGEGLWLSVSVTDTGPGIDSEDLPHVFDRFYRGDKSRSRTSGGTGLGLAIARQLVEAHDGKITVDNEPQGGARLIFVLPIDDKEDWSGTNRGGQ